MSSLVHSVQGKHFFPQLQYSCSHKTWATLGPDGHLNLWFMNILYRTAFNYNLYT